MPDKKYYYGTGRRKTAVARVRLYPGQSGDKVNDADATLPKYVTEPLEISGQNGKFSISAHTSGGGWSSQLQAIRLGISRALTEYDSGLRTTLKKSGLLSRDPRKTERKKPGLKKARKAPQWSKR